MKMVEKVQGWIKLLEKIKTTPTLNEPSLLIGFVFVYAQLNLIATVHCSGHSAQRSASEMKVAMVEKKRDNGGGGEGGSEGSPVAVCFQQAVTAQTN